MSERRPTVLCVDDEAPILHSLRRLFLDEPWDALFAQSGEEGLRLVAAHDVDLVLADFRMPGMDGVEFLKRVKAVRPECMRVVLSGYADITLIVAALNEGQIYKFLSKPWNDDELRHHVRRLLEHQRLDRENHRLTTELLDANRQLSRRVDASSRSTERLERTVEFARVALETLPVPFVGIDGRGDILVANAEARQLLRAGATEPLDRAMAAALAGARRSATGLHTEPFSVGGMTGTVVAIADTDPLDLARRKGPEIPGTEAGTPEEKP